MEFRIVRYDDLDRDTLYDILALRSAVFVEEQACAYRDVDGRDRHAYHMTCTDGGRLVGYLRILNRGETFDEMSIGRVVVTDRRRGIGTEMVRRALEFITENLNEDAVRIESQTYAAEMYERLGFVRIGEEFLEDGIPHVQMLYKKE